MAKTVIELEDAGDVRTILRLIRERQDDCRKATPEWACYKVYHELDCKLERLKMNIARQI